MTLKIELGEDNPILRAISTEVKKSDFKKYEKLLKNMLDYIKNPDNGGIGIAAPQVGINKRIIICSLPQEWEDEDYRTIAMINPEILDTSDEQTISKEGCLSLPKHPRGSVYRAKELKLKYLDSNAKPHTLILSGVAACVVQHEVDHLDGILYIDKLISDLPGTLTE